MKSWVRKSLIAFGVLVVLAGAAYYWLIVESHVPGDAQFAFDIGEVRRLANTAPGDNPAAIEVERIAEFRFPATAVVAGDGWRMSALPVFSHPDYARALGPHRRPCRTSESCSCVTLGAAHARTDHPLRIDAAG
jgi:hypothetical protein